MSEVNIKITENTFNFDKFGFISIIREIVMSKFGLVIEFY